MKIKKFNKNRYLPYESVYEQLVKHEITKIQSMVKATKEEENNTKKYVNKIINKIDKNDFYDEHDYDFYIDSLNDEIHEQLESNNLSIMLATIGLYRIAELFIKNIFSRTTLSDKKVNSLYKWKLYKNILKKFDVDIWKLKHIDIINELRCLNNSIKHSGYVNNELANFDGWVKDKEISSDEINLDKFIKVIPEYIIDVVRKVNDYLLANEKNGFR